MYRVTQWRIQDFPRGGANPQGAAPGYIFIKFSRKLHEIEKNLVARGGGGAPGAPPPDPPLEWVEYYTTEFSRYFNTRFYDTKYTRVYITFITLITD